MSEFVNRRFYNYNELYENTLSDEKRFELVEIGRQQYSLEKALVYYNILQRNLTEVADILHGLVNLLSLIDIRDMEDEWYMVSSTCTRLSRVQKKLMTENQSVIGRFCPQHLGDPHTLIEDCLCDDCEIIRAD